MWPFNRKSPGSQSPGDHPAPELPPDIESQFSIHRLGGEPLPADLRLLLSHREALRERTGIVLNWSSDWAPWRDTSYLTPEDLADPGIRANVRAIDDVCRMVAFVIADEDSNYLGYWRGPEHLPISQAPVVRLDNEGQFGFCGTENIAGAILVRGRVGPFEDFHHWLQSLGVASLPTGKHDVHDVKLRPSPQELHEQLYERYLAADDAS